MGDEPNLNNEQELRTAIAEARNKQFEEAKEAKSPAIEEEKDDSDDELPDTDKKVEEVEEDEKVEEEIEEDFSDDKSKKNAFQKLQHTRRLEKKKAKEEADILRNESAALRERMARIEGAQEVQQKEAVKEEVDLEPDKDEDYEAHQEWRLRQQDKKIDSLIEAQQKSEQMSEFRQAEQVWHDIENAHVEHDAVYKDAKDFLIKTLRNEASAQFPSATKSQIRDYVRDAEAKFVGGLAKQGASESHIIASMRTLADHKGFKVADKKTPQDKEKLKKNMSKSINLVDAPSSGATNETPLKHFMKQSNVDLMGSANNPVEAAKMEKALRKARLSLAAG